MMKKKIKSEAGVTVVEMLAAALILVLLSAMVGTGMSMAMHAYDKVVAQSEVELLLSSAVDALADELRYAWNVDTSTSTPSPAWSPDYTNVTEFTYSSDSFGDGIRLCVRGGKIVAKKGQSTDDDHQVLSNDFGAYGGNASYKEYEVKTMKITCVDDVFNIKLEIKGSTGISAGTTVQVRCLNPITS